MQADRDADPRRALDGLFGVFGREFRAQSKRCGGTSPDADVRPSALALGTTRAVRVKPAANPWPLLGHRPPVPQGRSLRSFHSLQQRAAEAVRQSRSLAVRA